jgi:hypothetical protein
MGNGQLLADSMVRTPFFGGAKFDEIWNGQFRGLLRLLTKQAQISQLFDKRVRMAQN